MVAHEPAELVLDLHVSLDQAAELERSEVNVPDSVVDLLEPYVLADAHDRDIDPVAFPANAGMPPLALT